MGTFPIPLMTFLEKNKKTLKVTISYKELNDLLKKEDHRRIFFYYKKYRQSDTFAVICLIAGLFIKKISF